MNWASRNENGPWCLQLLERCEATEEARRDGPQPVVGHDEATQPRQEAHSVRVLRLTHFVIRKEPGKAGVNEVEERRSNSGDY